MRRIQGMLLALAVLVAGHAEAAGLTFGQWRVATTAGGHYAYAATVNHQGELFGEFCDYTSASCRWLLAVHTPCHFGDVYPVLANSAAGANPIAIFCVGAIGEHTYGMALMNGKKLQASIAHARRVGFAVPLQNGRFTLSRFALQGRLQATALLNRSFSAEIERRQQAPVAELRL
jgi:hypothetical protein